ncbi:hypothetical protein San01_09490 [Streptomyces angustmyceticus]|uniref:Uncharacterized protein n=1 Tax=Streptomyces angustmyceticus TaxID=285578 RepID=A0A5J4L8C7_9ACTN|nr:hypothetical protein San01_09490 [Streptomyces angustmyceticus]
MGVERFDGQGAARRTHQTLDGLVGLVRAAVDIVGELPHGVCHFAVAYDQELARIRHHQHEATSVQFTVFQALAAVGVGHEQADDIVLHGGWGGGRGPRLEDG